MVFRYYIPRVTADQVTAALLAEVGLAERLWDCIDGDNLRRHLAINDVHAKGPDGSSGTLVVPLPRSGKPVPRLGWYADQVAVESGERRVDGEQRAESGENSSQPSALRSQPPAYWLIHDPKHPPTPTGLERLAPVDGYVRRLGDGSHWMCPIVRSELSNTDLPREYVLAGGEVTGRILPRYQAIWMRSIKWCLRFLDQCRELDATKFLTVKEAYTGAVECLALNYRVTAEELACFPGLLTDQTITSIIDAAIDWDFYRDCGSDEKKSASLDRVSAIMQQLLAPSEDSTSATDQQEAPSNSSAADTLTHPPTP